MKETELRTHLTCNLCNRAITASGLPLFWRFKVARFGLDLKAIQRQHGLGLAIGSPALAAIMGPGEDMAKTVMEEVTLTACEGCAMDNMPLLIHTAMTASVADEGVPK